MEMQHGRSSEKHEEIKTRCGNLEPVIRFMARLSSGSLCRKLQMGSSSYEHFAILQRISSFVGPVSRCNKHPRIRVGRASDSLDPRAPRGGGGVPGQQDRQVP